MTEEHQETVSEIQPNTPNTPETKKSNKKTWIIVSIVLAVIGLCIIICIAVFGVSMYKVYTETGPVTVVLDEFMTHMENQDVESAYALFSPRAQRQIPLSDIQDMLEGNNYILFEGYQNLSIVNLNISAAANTNPDLPQGTVATVTGTITYDEDIQGSFDATLEKVGETWMIDGVWVNVPPDKFK
jgi:hypothetical protein